MSDQTDRLLRKLEEQGADLDALGEAIAGALTGDAPSRGCLPWKASAPDTPVFFRYYDRGGGRTTVMAVALDFGQDRVVPTAETVPVGSAVSEAKPINPEAGIHNGVHVRRLNEPPTPCATRYVMQPDGEEERELWIGTSEDGTPVEAYGRDPVRTNGW